MKRYDDKFKSISKIDKKIQKNEFYGTNLPNNFLGHKIPEEQNL